MWNGQRKTQSVKLVSDTSFLCREVGWTSSPSMCTGFWNMILPWKPCLLRMISMALQLDFTLFASTLASNLWGSGCFFFSRQSKFTTASRFLSYVDPTCWWFLYAKKSGKKSVWPRDLGGAKEEPEMICIFLLDESCCPVDCPESSETIGIQEFQFWINEIRPNDPWIVMIWPDWIEVIQEWRSTFCVMSMVSTWCCVLVWPGFVPAAADFLHFF